MATFSHSSGDGRDSVLSNGSSAIPHDAEIIEIDDDSDEEIKDKGINISNDDEGTSEEDETEEDDYDEDEDQELEFENSDDEETEDEDEMSDDQHEDEEEVEEIASDYGGIINGIHSTEEQKPKLEVKREDFMSRSSGLISPSLLSSDVKQTLHPLQDMAERVLKQIESFAHNLDQFRRRAPSLRDPQSFHEVCKLVKNYQTIAEKNASDLSKPSPTRKPHRLTREDEKQTSLNEVEEQVARWNLETETWDLLYQLLSIADPETREQAKRSQETVLQSLHRYSSDHEVWEGFLKADHFARESVIVLQWLEKTVKSTTDLDAIISNLEKEADRGQGLWAHGWLYTKETIKGAKRLRSWPQPLDPEDNRITPSLLGSEKQAPLITQLDPDAVIRQGLGLQKQDQFYEQAAWLTCWKMLRSGQSWSKIRAWSQERLESWRAISVSGTSLDTTSKTGDVTNSSLVRMMSCRSQESWRSACAVLAGDPHTDRYEKAVYALLCGQTEPAYAVCQSWGDFLYVFYNHMILSRYNDFCKQFLKKLSLPSNQNAIANIEPPNYESILNFLGNLKKDERIAEEAKNPYRQIQAAILSRNFENFFYYHANAMSRAATTTRGPSLLPKLPPMVNTDDFVLITANDESSLRIVAHIYLMLSTIGMVRGDSYYTDTVAINVIRYIELLRDKEKVDLIPLYASMLPSHMGDTILGKVLIDVQGEHMRQGLLQRMRAFGIDVSAVLRSQWEWVLSEAGSDERKHIDIAGKFVATEDKPGSVSALPPNIIGRDVALEHQRLIRCLEWHCFVGTEWPALCSHAAYLYKRFFRHSQLAAARELCERIQFSKIPVPAEFRIIPFAVGSEEELDAQEQSDDRPASPVKSGRSLSPLKSAGGHQRRRSSIKANKTTARRLSLQAQTVEDLELLVSTFDAMEDWGNLCDEYLQLPNPERKRSLQHQLQQSIDVVTENVNPLCQNWLCQPVDDDEVTELEMIRTAYLPEVVLLYHNSLYLAGCTIGREVLAQCMTLAIAVAGSPSLTECFVSAGRMRELVRALAMSSMAVMAIKDPKLKKKLPRNATLDIWKIQPIEEDAAGLTLVWPKD